MKFRKYQHIARYGLDGNCRGIELGICHIFPKIDGTNCQTYISDNLKNIKCGSRNMELDETVINSRGYNGFYEYAISNESIRNFHMKYKNLRLYGEWLVPHSFEEYRENAWNKFYIFDVIEEIDEDNDEFRYLSFDEYLPILKEFNLDYIPPIIMAEGFNYDKLLMYLDKNRFLVKDGKGAGEGIVIKRYDFINENGRTIWAKLVRGEFKELHAEKFGFNDTSFVKPLEEKIIETFLTEPYIEKEYCKFIEKYGEWNRKLIPLLFNHIRSELYSEEINNIIEIYKNPIINFSILNNLIIDKIKKVKKELF